MELHQLRYFLAVVNHGTFTAAAAAAGISQSGISTQVQKLERELGVPLLDRSARRVRLTRAGEQLVPQVREVIGAVGRVTGAANDLRGLVTGSLRVVTVTGLTWPRLFDALATLHHRHPGIDITLREGISANLVQQVRSGAADLAIAAWSGDAPQGVRTMMAFEDTLVAVVAPGHPWVDRTSVGADELAGADLISLPPGTGARSALDAVLTDCDTSVTAVDRSANRPGPRWEVTTPAFVQMLAARSLGVGIVSALTAREWAGVVPVPVDHRGAWSRLGVLWRDPPSHATRALLHELADSARSSSDQI